MIPAPFDYHRPSSLDEAIGLLTKHGEQAKVLSGGMSLLPTLKLRLGAFAHLVDINRISGLDGIKEEGGALRIGGCLQEFNARYRDALINRRTTVMIVSDGLDHGDAAILGGAMRALRERAGRVVWLNPLLGDARYRPEAEGMRAALPYVDHFGAAHNYDALAGLIRHLG